MLLRARLKADERAFGVEGPYCKNPVLTTGAGDHFNGGFVSALLAGLTTEEALYAAVATSGWYVRNGRSPGASDLMDMLGHWGD